MIVITEMPAGAYFNNLPTLTSIVKRLTIFNSSLQDSALYRGVMRYNIYLEGRQPKLD